MQTPGEDQDVGAYSLFNFRSQRPLPYKLQLSVAGQPLKMDVDTRASLSVISEEPCNSFFSAGQAHQLVESGIFLRTYTGEEVKSKRSCTVNVCYDGVECSLRVLVVGGKGLALPGRNWLYKIKLNWPIIKQLSSHNMRLEEILQKHAQLF